VTMTSISSELGTEVSLQTVRENLVPHLNRNLGPGDSSG
jgi:hypothetical protein